MNVCPACHAIARGGQKFCRACGKQLPPTAVEDNTDAAPHAGPEETEPATLFCPLCQALYPASAVYCEADGTPLEKIEKYVMSTLDDGKKTQRPEVSLSSAAERAPAPRPRLLILWAALIVVVFAAGFYYFSGQGDGPATLEREVSAALRTRGLDIAIRADRTGQATLEGTVKSQEDREAALAIAKAHKGVKGVSDAIKVAASPIETERTLNKALDDAGLTGVQTQVDEDFEVVLSGVVRNERENVLAEKTVKAFPEIRSTQNLIKVEKTPASQATADGNGSFAETRRFSLAALSPASWASLKYRDTITFRVPGPGRLSIEATWDTRETLALMLNNATSNVSHTQKDGVTPLKLTYRITAQDFEEGPQWEATIANFTAQGPIKGVLKVSFSSAATVAQRAAFDAGRVERELNDALKAQGLASVTAEVSKDGNVTLKGSAPNAETKERALTMARRIKSVKTVKDIIFVVGS